MDLFLAVFGLLCVLGWTEQVEVTTRLVNLPRSTLRISGLLNVTRRREPLRRNLRAILPTPAVCKPVPHLIEFVAAENPLGFEFQPSCIRVNRCNGCCGNSFFSCQISRAVLRELQIIVRSRDRLNDGGTLTKVIVEEHEACGCQCTIKAEQCDSKADYNEDLCRCICRDQREENACKEQSRTKIWNSDHCTCGCREIEPCSEGLEFDHLNCRCKLKPRNKHEFI